MDPFASPQNTARSLARRLGSPEELLQGLQHTAAAARPENRARRDSPRAPAPPGTPVAQTSPPLDAEEGKTDLGHRAADVFDFLELRKNHGKEEQRARDLFYAMWIPDLFMRRVEEDSTWTLMCPNECPGLYDSHGDEVEKKYLD